MTDCSIQAISCTYIQADAVENDMVKKDEINRPIFNLLEKLPAHYRTELVRLVQRTANSWTLDKLSKIPTGPHEALPVFFPLVCTLAGSLREVLSDSACWFALQFLDRLNDHITKEEHRLQRVSDSSTQNDAASKLASVRITGHLVTLGTPDCNPLRTAFVGLSPDRTSQF